MKTRFFLGILALMLLTSCAARESRVPQNTRINQLNIQQSNPVGGIEVLTSKTLVKRGENGIIVIRGRPGVIYSISASYKTAGKTLVATEHETAKADGIVTWNWFVAPGTLPGVYPIEITGGGDYLRTTYTVSQ